ncbi:hypothetical protein DJ013_22005 [Arcticibacterium luteifluviistationis]|uniref:Uncharacterized protein n=2 Tax=Arcticibacterium luteifluviistationis TaxID=1784714 RepID=A0A2Z4GI52_9BACT|nr:hypothetical protein DJ013_22005 [Arcticibacterium luteifluviistationis]
MYVVGLLLTAFPLFLFYQILEKEAAHSMLLSELVPDFSFMIFSDFMAASGKAFKPVFKYALLSGFVGSIVYTFFSGGVIDQLANLKQGFSFGRFFKKSASHFPKYFGLLLLIGILLFVFFLVAGFVYFIFAAIANGSTERGYVLWLIPPSIFLFVLMTYGLTVSFYAKVFIYKEPRIGFVKAFWEAFYYVFRQKTPLVYFWMTIGLGFCILLIYLLLDKYIGMTSALTIALMAVFQQLFVFSKFVLKHWNYALALEYFEKAPVNLAPPVVEIEEELETEQLQEEDEDSDQTKLSEPEEGS